MVRDLDTGELVNGKTDPATGSAFTGVEVVFQEFHTSFGPMAQSRAIESVENLMIFKRKSGESMHNMIIRFDETYRRANHEGGMVFNAVALTYLLVQVVVGVDTEALFILQNDFNGAYNIRTQYHPQKQSTGDSLNYSVSLQKKRSSEGSVPLNFTGNKHSSRPQYPSWETTDKERCDENDVWQHDDEQTWYKQGTDLGPIRRKRISGSPRRTTRVENAPRTFERKRQRKRKGQSTCGSVHHLRMKCPKETEKQKGNPIPMGKDQSTSISPKIDASFLTLVRSSTCVAKNGYTESNVSGRNCNAGLLHARLSTELVETHQRSTQQQCVDARSVRGEHTKIPITFTVDVLSQSSVPALLGLNSMGYIRAKMDSEKGTISF
eukprot:3317155-Amphidinium_carterae.1